MGKFVDKQLLLLFWVYITYVPNIMHHAILLEYLIEYTYYTILIFHANKMATMDVKMWSQFKICYNSDLSKEKFSTFI